MPRYTRCLVTGGAGVIGSHLVDALRARGSEVTVLDNLTTGKHANIAAHTEGPGFRLVQGDILDQELVDRLVADHEVVYHLAAAVGVKHIVNDPLGSVLANVRGTEHVLASAFRSGTPVLIASTSEIYGRNLAPPFAEDSERVLGPTWVHRWSYSTAKAIDEHLGFAYSAKGLPVTIVRYFNSYGPRIDESGYGTVVARFASQALSGRPLTVHGDGAQTRCFTYVADTVRGTILAAEMPAANGKVFNIGSTEEVSIAQLAELVQEIAGRGPGVERVSYETYYGPGFEDTMRRVPDVRRAVEVLGFRAETPLREGLRRTIEWCASNYAASRS
ncbi:MAG: GDP-mannose 4,6-dehydratase [Chloroflexi bacterium]|nr:GDP-mannose 4,6-dehydratase [Chloroflexota bacterium]